MIGLIKALFSNPDTNNALVLDATTRFLSMLDQAGELLIAAEPWVLNQQAPEELRKQARSVDKASNKSEREVRKMLVEALAFDNSHGPLCLVLMSVAKDGERLVDECRNLVDLPMLMRSPVPEVYANELHSITKELITTIQATRKAFAANDRAAAIELVEGEKPTTAKLHAIEDRLFDDESLGSRQAIILSRAFRYLHRIRAHLANIASTVIMPVHQIDFAKAKYLEEAKRDLARDKKG